MKNTTKYMHIFLTFIDFRVFQNVMIVLNSGETNLEHNTLKIRVLYLVKACPLYKI
jgi:hypothetical protein